LRRHGGLPLIAAAFPSSTWLECLKHASTVVVEDSSWLLCVHRYAIRKPNVEFTTVYYMPAEGCPVPLLIGRAKGKVPANEELRWQYDETLQFWLTQRDNTRQYNFWVEKQRYSKTLEQRVKQLTAMHQVGLIWGVPEHSFVSMMHGCDCGLLIV
jgi:hypothetical protein